MTTPALTKNQVNPLLNLHGLILSGAISVIKLVTQLLIVLQNTNVLQQELHLPFQIKKILYSNLLQHQLHLTNLLLLLNLLLPPLPQNHTLLGLPLYTLLMLPLLLFTNKLGQHYISLSTKYKKQDSVSSTNFCSSQQLLHIPSSFSPSAKQTHLPKEIIINTTEKVSLNS